MAVKLPEMRSHDELVKGIDAFTKKAGDLDNELHELAVQTILHARPQPEGHGDARLADRLIRALGKSQNAKGLRFWYETFTPIRWNGDGNVGLLKEGAKKYTPFRIEEAIANPFWDMDEVKQDQEKNLRKMSIYDIYRFIDGLPERIERMNKEGRFDGNPLKAMEIVGRLKSVPRIEDETSSKYKSLVPAAQAETPKPAQEAPAPEEPAKDERRGRGRAAQDQPAVQ